MPIKPKGDLCEYDRLVGHIYDASLDVTKWPMVMQQLASTLNAKSCMLRVQNLNSKDVGIWISHGLDLSYQPQYKEHYVHIDPLIQAVSEIPVGTIMQTSSFLHISTFRRTEFYNDYAKPQAMLNTAGGFLAKDKDQVAVIGLHRANDSKPYTQNEMAILKMLTPHMQRAFQVNHRLATLERRDAVVGEILDRLPDGVVLVDAQGRPVFVNRNAMKLNLKDNGLSVKADSVTALLKQDRTKLHQLIFEASKSDRATGGSLVIRGPNHAKPTTLLVTPIKQDNRFDLGADSSQITAAIFIGSPGQPYALPLELLASLYGFTPAEAKLAAAIANGYSLQEIAESLNISKNTARNQLKACFNKTGVKRQAELVNLILSSVPNLASDVTHGYLK